MGRNGLIRVLCCGVREKPRWKGSLVLLREGGREERAKGNSLRPRPAGGIRPLTTVDPLGRVKTGALQEGMVGIEVLAY